MTEKEFQSILKSHKEITGELVYYYYGDEEEIEEILDNGYEFENKISVINAKIREKDFVVTNEIETKENLLLDFINCHPLKWNNPYYNVNKNKLAAHWPKEWNNTKDEIISRPSLGYISIKFAKDHLKVKFVYRKIIPSKF
jgi:hypothetical protein